MLISHRMHLFGDSSEDSTWQVKVLLVLLVKPASKVSHILSAF